LVVASIGCGTSDEGEVSDLPCRGVECESNEEETKTSEDVAPVFRDFEDEAERREEAEAIRAAEIANSGEDGLGNGQEDPRFVDVVIGYRYICLLDAMQRVACFGSGGSMEAPDSRFKALAAGQLSACGIQDDDTLLCWGADYSPTIEAPEGEFTALSMGPHHACAIGLDGEVSCWGKNTAVHADQDLIYPVLGQTEAPEGQFVSVSAGYEHSCGMRADRTIACWGSNVDTFPNGATWERDEMGQATPPSGRFLSVSAGYMESCGVREDGQITCWGRETSPVVTDAPKGDDYVSVSLGRKRGCALRANGNMVCWGTYSSETPRDHGFQAVATSKSSTFSCGVTDAGDLTCFGHLDPGVPKTVNHLD
jgi:alpha-tubulin suppressor-like RCC1 family protein